MSGLDKDRQRNQTISFRVSPEERRQLEARIKICGMKKGEYFIKSLLFGGISIAVGKYQSDRLSLELRRLREQLQACAANNEESEIANMLKDCMALLAELLTVTQSITD